MLASHWLAQDSLVQNLDYFGENKLFSKKKKKCEHFVISRTLKSFVADRQ